jgi:hypothetical protein
MQSPGRTAFSVAAHHAHCVAALNADAAVKLAQQRRRDRVTGQAGLSEPEVEPEVHIPVEVHILYNDCGRQHINS